MNNIELFSKFKKGDYIIVNGSNRGLYYKKGKNIRWVINNKLFKIEEISVLNKSSSTFQKTPYFIEIKLSTLDTEKKLFGWIDTKSFKGTIEKEKMNISDFDLLDIDESVNESLNLNQEKQICKTLKIFWKENEPIPKRHKKMNDLFNKSKLEIDEKTNYKMITNFNKFLNENIEIDNKFEKSLNLLSNKKDIIEKMKEYGDKFEIDKNNYLQVYSNGNLKNTYKRWEEFLVELGVEPYMAKKLKDLSGF